MCAVEKPRKKSAASSLEVVAPEKLRLRLSEYVDAVAEQRRPILAGTNEDNPPYLLQCVSSVPKDVVEAAIPVGIDKARRAFATIRALVRYVDFVFGIERHGEMVVILRRNPIHRAPFRDEFIRIRDEKRKQVEGSAATRLLEEAVPLLKEVKALLGQPSPNGRKVRERRR